MIFTPAINHINLFYSLCLLFLVACIMYGCSNSSHSPYPEFEAKLKNQLCECILVGNVDQKEFLKEYEICQTKMSKILKKGLDGYEENKDVSKDEYLQKLPELIDKLKDDCRFNR